LRNALWTKAISVQPIYLFRVDGAPRTKKNHSRIVTNRKTGKPFLISSKSAKGWETTAVEQLSRQWPNPPLECPVHVNAQVHRERRTGDLVNYMQAIADALEKAGVIANDRLIMSWDKSRLRHNKEMPHVELTIKPMDDV
jgi:Holliday junction resolvase RusA-like endonuclease